ncbi:MAG: hypothetical protein V5B36_00835 [Candidatus Accumulibacter sp. UW25]
MNKFEVVFTVKGSFGSFRTTVECASAEAVPATLRKLVGKPVRITLIITL